MRWRNYDGAPAFLSRGNSARAFSTIGNRVRTIARDRQTYVTREMHLG